MEMSDKIRELRDRLELTLEQVGNAVGVGKSTVRKWENGDIKNMRRDKIAALARVLQTTPAYLMGWEEEETPSIPTGKNIIPLPKMRMVPLVGNIACGTPILAAENIMANVPMPEHVRADFALRCKGDSMTGARVYDGDIVFIRTQPDVENGEIAAVLLGEEATLKRVYKAGKNLILQPENTTYQPIVIAGDDLDGCRIIGKAVAFTSVMR